MARMYQFRENICLASSTNTEITADEIVNVDTEAIYAKLLRRGNGGSGVVSHRAPALATQFVKSTQDHRAQAGDPGYFADLIYPADSEVAMRMERKHLDAEVFGYRSAKQASAFPAGFGERSAKALAREETTYQLKGTFPAAMLNYTKLRACVEARSGDIVAVDDLFSKMWGLDKQDVDAIPKLVVEGTEQTRVSALEDRAYHSLSGHPGHTGGFRVDLATLPSDALGDDVPINWPRVRTALKAIASTQLVADSHMAMLIRQIQKHGPARFGMEFVKGSQPRYKRGSEWEIVIHAMYDGPDKWHEYMLQKYSPYGLSIASTEHESRMLHMIESYSDGIIGPTLKIAQSVARESSQALQRTIEVMLNFDQARRPQAEQDKLTYEELTTSEMARSFEVPRYKLTTTTLQRGITRPYMVKSILPDMQTQVNPPLQLDMRELRESHMSLETDISGAMNLAVYLTTQRQDVQVYAYMLMHYIPAPPEGDQLKVAVRLRKRHLYDAPEVRALGPYLFGEAFLYTLDHVLHNMKANLDMSELSIKAQIWEYLTRRADMKGLVAPAGGWKDLIYYAREHTVGWTLYYWVRVTVGKTHRGTTEGIMAPIRAGQVIDFLGLIKATVKQKASKWRDFYSARYKKISGDLEDRRNKRLKNAQQRLAESDATEVPAAKYIPPHLRKSVDLEDIYDADAILSRTQQYEEEQYEQMVEAQSKAKFFATISTFTIGSRIAVGITDASLHEMLVEFYQARWYSLEKRIAKAKSRGVAFKLGRHIFQEHPWGELKTDLPLNAPDMLSMMSQLDPRAWTIDPTYLQTKFAKSISELWADISDDIANISRFVEDVYEDRASEQTMLVEEKAQLTTLGALRSVDAIPVPAVGYIPPYVKPVRVITIEEPTHDLQETKVVPMVPMAMSAVSTSALPEESLDDLEGFDDDDIDIQLVHMETEIVACHTNYLTYQEIWHELGLPDTSEWKMKFVYALPTTIATSDQHIDSTFGPLVLAEERELTLRKWGHKLHMMRYRLNASVESAIDDDLR